MEVHLAVNIALLAIVALGLLWSVFREMHIHAMQRSQEQAAAKLIEHLGSINKLLEVSGRLVDQVWQEINESDSLSREKRTEMLAYLRDIEIRLTAAIHDTRDWMRDNFSRGNIFNSNSGPGGQTNQGGDVRGDQR